jgi:putative copper export protein
VRADQALLTVHVVAVAMWIGAALALQILGARLDPSTNGAVADRFALDAEAVGKTIFGPAAVLVLLTGVALVIREDLGWTTPWIYLGVGALVVALALGAVHLIPEGRRVAELARTPGHDPDEVRTRSRRRLVLARIDLTLLVLAVADMVFRIGD